MMNLGTIPITSRFEKSVLFELTAGFDMGPSRALSSQSPEEYQSWLPLWLESVLQAAQEDAVGGLEKMRTEMISESGRKFDWMRTASVFLHIVDRSTGEQKLF